MSFSINEIAVLLKGVVQGNNTKIIINGLARIEDATEGSITFLSNPKYNSFLATSKASAIVVNKDFDQEPPQGTVIIKVDNAYDAFTKLTALFQKKNDKIGIAPSAVIHPTVQSGENIYLGDFVSIGENTRIGNNVKIFPHTYIGDDVIIGDNSVIYSGVKIYSDCVVGAHCKIHAGAVIGSDGFGFAPQQDNSYSKIEQIGNVVIEDYVEIGANTTIDRAAIGSTILRKGVKLDNLIQIAHNVEIGENTVVAAQAGISGSTKIGKNCMIGGQVGIVGHLTIGNNVMIAAQSGIGSNLIDNAVVQGSPAFNISDYRKAYVCFKKLPQYFNLFYKIKTD